MNLQAYAAHRKARGLRGGTHVAVLEAIRTGRLTEPAVVKNGRFWNITAELADVQWADNTNAMQVRGVPDPVPPELPPPASTKHPVDAPPKGRQPHPIADGPSMAQAQRAKAVYQAELARLEVMRTKGESVLIDEVKQEASRLARQVRDLLLTIPGRNAAKLTTMSDTDAVRALLTQEIESALRGLANA